MKKFVKATSLLLASLMVCAACACKAEETTASTTTTQASETETEAPSESENGESETEATTEADPNATAYPITVTDIYGQTATIEEDPQRIVSCSPSITELIYSLGQEDCLVGRTDYCTYPEDVFAIDSVGEMMNPNIETIVSMEPDIILADSIFSEESYDKLTELGYTVVILNEEKAVDGVYKKIETLGQILDANEEAAAVVEDMKTRIADVKDAIADYADEKPTVYYVVSYGEYGDYTCGGDTYIHTIIEDAGGINIAADISGWSFSREDLIAADPDIIIVPGWAYDDFIVADGYSDLSAVKNGQVYTIDTDMLDRQCARNADAVEELAKIFYPEAFAGEKAA